MIKIVDKLFSVLSRPWRAARFKREMKKAFPPDGTMVKRPPVVNVELNLSGICTSANEMKAAEIDLTQALIEAFPPDGTIVKRPPVVNVELRLDGICAKTPPTAAAAIDLTNSKFPKIADIELDLPNQRQT